MLEPLRVVLAPRGRCRGKRGAAGAIRGLREGGKVLEAPVSTKAHTLWPRMEVFM